jgi:hypothetical protein
MTRAALRSDRRRVIRKAEVSIAAPGHFFHSPFQQGAGVFFGVLALVALPVDMVAAVPADAPADLTGNFDVNPTAGLLKGHVCISGNVAEGTDGFVLNRGLNIRAVTDAATGELIEFDRAETPASNDGMKYELDHPVGAGGFCVDYVGAFPVYRVDAGERGTSDWKGLIAFDGHGVRATDQTRFYPVAIDKKSGVEIDSMSYRVQVRCRRCRTIYMNGAAPAPGPVAQFASALPRQLFLYAGEFPARTVAGAHFIGVPVTVADAKTLSDDMRAIALVNQDYLQVPFGDTPSFLSFPSVARSHKLGKIYFQFVVWPTIAMDGRVPFKTLLSPQTGHMLPDSKRYLAHEAAHYYFGTLYQPHGPLHWFLVESTAEFLSMKFVRRTQGEDAFRKLWDHHVSEAEKLTDVVPLDCITDPEQIGDKYRYRLGPLLLFELERYVGSETVRRALSDLVQQRPSAEIDYKLFAARLTSAGARQERLDAFARDCLVPQVSDRCLAYPAN